MLTSFQWRWGVAQWVEFLKDKEIPVLLRTQALMQALASLDTASTEAISARDLAGYVFADPYLSLKLLRHAENRRSRRLGQETTTTLAAVLHTGWNELVQLVSASSVSDDSCKGRNDCEFRAVLASSIARGWASLRSDVSPDEVALAALLSESGELLLWYFAPELPLKVADELASGRAFRPLRAQEQAIGFTFRQMTVALVEAWELPPIIALLIRGTDSLRANIARLAVDTARDIVANNRHPSIPAQLVNLQRLIPSASHAQLLAPLPIADDYREEVLLAVSAESEPQGGRKPS